MTPPSYEAPGSKVLKGHLRIPQTFSSVDNPLKVGRLCAFGPYRLDFERRLLMRDREVVPLHEKALEILIVLVRHRGEVVSKDELMKAVWPDAFVEEANLSQNVFVLRKALGERPKENRYIATIPGRGYSFVASLEEMVECANEVSQGTAVEQDAGEASGESQDEPSIVSWLAWYLKLRTAPTLVLIVAATGLVLGLMQLPKIARYFNNRGVVHQQKGDIGAAIGDYQWALRFSPGYAAAHYNLGDAYEEIPDYVKALEQYQRAIDADPMFYQAYNNLSRLYILRQKDYGAAMRLLDRALSFQPKEPSVQYTLYKNYGWANFEMGQFGQAERNLQIAVGLGPQRGSAHCLLAKVLNGQGKALGALPEWESCLRYSYQPEVEPEWRNAAQEIVTAQAHRSGG